MAPISVQLEHHQRGLTAISTGSVRLPIAVNESGSYSFAPSAVNRPKTDEIAPGSPATGNRTCGKERVFCQALKSLAFSKFVYLWLRRLYDAGELFQFETGTTGIKNFAFVIFAERYPLVVPDLRVAEAFNRTVSPFFDRIQANSQESRTLATLRDTLLPQLLSGSLQINNRTDQSHD